MDWLNHAIMHWLFIFSVLFCFQISVIPDDLEVIAKEVSEFSKKYKYVLTAGGIGPTHDDLTFEGIGWLFCL